MIETRRALAAKRAEAWAAPIRRVVALLGGEEGHGQKRLADATGASRAQVSQWFNGDRRVSAQFVLSIEEAVEGQVSRHEMRPDIFGPPPAPAASGQETASA